jgi:pimeloyl-ACP methyl ester carboxylesterase
MSTIPPSINRRRITNEFHSMKTAPRLDEIADGRAPIYSGAAPILEERPMLSRAIALALIALAVQFAATAADRPTKATAEEGEIAGAKFHIDIPDNWNGGLVMYAHGYAMVAQEPKFNLDVSKAFQSLGFAVAQSLYSHQGWAAREGILDTEALRRYFVDKYGPTYPTIIAGHSQGGAITYATIEKFPEIYDGALPMCAAGPSALGFFKDRVFDMRVLFDYYFPGLPDGPIEFPDGEQSYTKVMAKANELIKAEPEKAKAFAQMTTLSAPEAIPGVIAFWTEILRELTLRTGGSAFDNTNTIYSGSADDITLNKEINRYTANPKSVEYLHQWVTMTGEIADPVLALHTMTDDLIPPAFANRYANLATLAGHADLYAQAWTDGKNHCAFNAEETTEALRQLVDWIKTGKRPTVGDWTKKK